jgi:hypothetical protein
MDITTINPRGFILGQMMFEQQFGSLQIRHMPPPLVHIDPPFTTIKINVNI